MEKKIVCPKGYRTISSATEENGTVTIEYEKITANEVEKKKDSLDSLHDFMVGGSKI